MAKKRCISAKFRQKIAETRMDLKFHIAEISENILQNFKGLSLQIWTWGMDIQQGHEAGTWRMDMQHGDVHEHTSTCTRACTCMCCTHTRKCKHVHIFAHKHVHTHVQYICSKISFRFADFTDGILPKRNETWLGRKTKFRRNFAEFAEISFRDETENYISGNHNDNV